MGGNEAVGNLDGRYGCRFGETIGLASHHLEKGRAGAGLVIRGRRRHWVEKAGGESGVEFAERGGEGVVVGDGVGAAVDDGGGGGEGVGDMGQCGGGVPDLEI